MWGRTRSQWVEILRHPFARGFEVAATVSAVVSLVAFAGKVLLIDGKPLIDPNSELYSVDTALTLFLAAFLILSLAVSGRIIARRYLSDLRVRQGLEQRTERADVVFINLLQKIVGFASEVESHRGFRYAQAREQDIPLIIAWSEEDANIGAAKVDRVALYARWSACEPRAFSLLWFDDLDGTSTPLGCSIVLPLTELGMRVLRVEGGSALQLKEGDIVPWGFEGPRRELLIDTWLRNPTLPAREGPGFARMARLLGRHLDLFSNEDANIWFEPDHRVLKKLGSLSEIMEDCGSASMQGSRTYRFDLRKASAYLSRRNAAVP